MGRSYPDDRRRTPTTGLATSRARNETSCLLVWFGLAGASAGCIPDRLQVGTDIDAGRSCPDGGCMRVFAADQPTPQGVVVASARVHWTTDNEVRSCGADDCDGGPRTLAAGQGTPWGIAANATHVCWTNADSGEVMACAVGGCDAGPTLVATGQSQPRFVAASDVNYFWTSLDWGAVLRNDVTNKPKWIASNQARPTSVVFLDNELIWVNEGDDVQAATGLVQHCTAGSSALCTPAPYVKGLQHPTAVAADATRVYWTELGASVTEGRVAQRSRGNDGSPVVVLAEHQSEPLSLVVDGARAYWTNRSGGQVMACSIDGCAGQPVILADGLLAPTGLAQDSQALYVAETGASRVLKILKGW